MNDCKNGGTGAHQCRLRTTQEKKLKVERQVASLLKEGKKTEAIEMLTEFNIVITLSAQEFVRSLPRADKKEQTAR